MTNNSETIKIWAWGDYVDAANKASEIYIRDVDSDVNIEVENMERDVLYKKLNTELRDRNDLPDIVLLDDEKIKSYLKEFSFPFVPLNEYMAQYNGLGNFIPYKIEQVTYDNETYGVPYSSAPAVLYYRKEVFEQEGIEINDNLTWDEFRGIGEQLKGNGRYLLPPLDCFDMQIFLLSTGNCYLDENGNVAPSGISAAMEQLKEFYDLGLIYQKSPEEIESPRTLLKTAIEEGTPAFIGGWSWCAAIKEISEELGIEDWQVAKIPKSEIFMNDVGLSGCSWMVIDRGIEEKKDKAIDFLMRTFAESTELALDMAEKYNIVPVFQEAIEELAALETDPCFGGQNAIQFAAELGLEIPEIQQKEYRQELTSCFKYWFKEVIYNEFPMESIDDKFSEICNCLYELDPTKFYEILLSDIRVSKAPDKVSYIEGETFDSTGMKVFAEYFNQPSGFITNYTYSPTGAFSVGDHAITISYTINDITKTFDLWFKVNPKSVVSLTLEQMPTKTVYLEREFFDKAGMVVRAFYDNGTSELVTDYFCTPTDRLKMEDTKITVSYTRGSATKTTTLPITVKEGAPLSKITVVTLPDQTVYEDDEDFDTTGMVVRAEYTDNTSMIVTDYTVTPETLAALDSEITISYTEKEITKITKLLITVLDNVKGNCKINQTELKYECGAGSASVNLFNQRLLFEHPDLSIGVNTYQIGVSHIYNSLFDEKKDLKNGSSYLQTYMGKGFKLNVQQYIIPKGKSYVYIDEAGYKHKFVLLNDRGSYYDKSGLGLTLTLESNEKIISDTFGNKMYFDIAGRLVKTVSGYNTNIIKRFTYNRKGQLIEIFDARTPENIISLEYDSTTDLLRTISGKQNGEVKLEISYSYKKTDTDFMLVDITDVRGGSSFAYNTSNKAMRYAASKLDKSALEFHYYFQWITEVYCGVIDDKTPIDQNSLISSGNISMPEKNIKSQNVFDVKKTVATVTNEKGVRLVYYFNPKGVVTGILESDNWDIKEEKINDGRGNEWAVNDWEEIEEKIFDLRSLEKQPGIRMTDNGNSLRKINGQKIHLVSDKVLTTDDLMASSFQAIKEYRQKKCPDYKYYICSFWLKIYEKEFDCGVKMTVQSKNLLVSTITDESRVTFDGTAVHSWQLVTIPIKISGENIEKIKIEFETGHSYEIGDMRLYYSPLTRFCVGSRTGTNTPLDEITYIKFKLWGKLYETVMYIGPECYMNEKDLQATHLSLYSDSGYILSLCNNTVKYKVTEAYLYNEKTRQRIPLSTENGKAQFYQETKSPDGEISVYGELYFNQDAAGNAFSGICQYTEAVKGETKSSSSINVNYKGKVTKEVDEYGVETIYEYDGDGNPNKKIIRHPDLKEQLVYTMTTTDVKTTEITPVSHTETCYDGLFGNVAQVNYRGKGESEENTLSNIFKYDALNRLERVENNIDGKNHLKYDENGRLSEVRQTNEDEFGYKFEYDRFGDLKESYLIFGTDRTRRLSSKEIDREKNTVTDNRFRSSGNDETITTLDKYGRTTAIKLSRGNELSESASFTRQGDLYNEYSIDESAGAAAVTQMEDSCEQRKYNYSYDDRNNCTGYTTFQYQRVEKGDFSIKMTGECEVSYEFINELFWKMKTQITDDPKVLMNPQVTQIKNIVTTFEDEGAEFGNVVDYEYDKLGRMKKKTVFLNKGFYDQKDTTVTTENVYKIIDVKNGDKLATTLKEKVTHTFKEEAHEYTYEHDERGRITNFTRKKTMASQTEASVISYKYDDCDRLKSETSGGVTRKYTYYNHGGLHTEICDTQTTNYTYNYYGRLERISGNKGGNFAYDDFGNCINYDGVSLEWERGSLLKKFGDMTYSYNIQGKRFKKELGNKLIKYTYDGGKLLGESEFEYKSLYEEAPPKFISVDENAIGYLYDLEGIVGFCRGKDRYLYLKDAQGNVLGIVKDNQEVARYEYDAWGTCRVINPKTGKEDKDLGFIGNINPIRWKSQYYDQESGLYYIDGRYYSPLMKQYISAANPETALANAAVVYGLNLYLLSLTNPVGMVYNGYTIEPNGDLVYDAEKLSGWDLRKRWWKAFWGSDVGKIIGIDVFLAATLMAVLCPAFAPIYVGTAIGVGITLGIGGAIAGYRSRKQGSGFWEGFGNYINENWSQTVAISYIIAMLSFGVSQAVAAVRNAIANKQLANAITQPSSEIGYIKYDDMLSSEKAAYDGYSKNGWKGNYPGQAKGTKAGSSYMNVDNKLPLGSYREFDINPPIVGIGRDASRFVVSNDKIVYLTRDHYSTFFKIIN